MKDWVRKFRWLLQVIKSYIRRDLGKSSIPIS